MSEKQVICDRCHLPIMVCKCTHNFNYMNQPKPMFPEAWAEFEMKHQGLPPIPIFDQGKTGNSVGCAMAHVAMALRYRSAMQHIAATEPYVYAYLHTPEFMEQLKMPTSTTTEEIGIGSCVRLKMGGPIMMVDSIVEGSYLCVWFNGGVDRTTGMTNWQLMEEDFDVANLTLAVNFPPLDMPKPGMPSQADIDRTVMTADWSEPD